MHIIFNEDHYLDNSSVPIDLNQEPADLVILSFSDSDLNAFANAWKKTLVDFGRESVPTLRLANIKQLTHNFRAFHLKIFTPENTGEAPFAEPSFN